MWLVRITVVGRGQSHVPQMRLLFSLENSRNEPKLAFAKAPWSSMFRAVRLSLWENSKQSRRGKGSVQEVRYRRSHGKVNQGRDLWEVK